ncbi:lysozyme g-like [Lampris incognitus]|uniref:lysozyme g-like n=1 Tax=Lampris incognitus TaxID=2546036 RepID=UPI0024B53D6C|nr:lysozyme g-like [Lampris incognitus]
MWTHESPLFPTSPPEILAHHLVSEYGNVSNVDTTGASSVTATADGRSSRGVAASREMAASDLPHINNYKDKIVSAARRNGVEPSVVAGIISRETRGGRGAGLHNGWGDNGNGFGLMQVDKRWHNPTGGWDSEEHINQGIKVFKDSYNEVGRGSDWNKDQRLKGALAAYNAGAGRVSSSYNDVDAQTTGGDYANDVVARAQYFKQHGYN